MRTEPAFVGCSPLRLTGDWSVTTSDETGWRSYRFIYCEITICDELFKLMVALFQNGIFSGKA